MRSSHLDLHGRAVPTGHDEPGDVDKVRRRGCLWEGECGRELGHDRPAQIPQRQAVGCQQVAALASNQGPV